MLEYFVFTLKVSHKYGFNSVGQDMLRVNIFKNSNIMKQIGYITDELFSYNKVMRTMCS